MKRSHALTMPTVKSLCTPHKKTGNIDAARGEKHTLSGRKLHSETIRSRNKCTVKRLHPCLR